MSVANPNLRGIQAMALAMGSFVINDALVKYVSQSLGGAQLILIRGVLATFILLGAAAALGQLRPVPPAQPYLWRELLSRRVLLRATMDALATMAYLASLFHLPIANVTAINMATPLIITLYAVLAMGERVGRLRWLALMIGFLGVVLVVQPDSSGFNRWALLCLLGTLFHTARDVLTRGIPQHVPSLLIAVVTSVTVSLLAGSVCLVQGWQPVNTAQWAQLTAASAFLSGGYYFIIKSMRSGQMSVVAPFRYTGLLFALVLGWLVWGDIPNLLAWIGIAMLVGSGLYVLRAAPEPQSAGVPGGKA
jgi:drug/metabolite transporter (DMT)-like permease